MEKASSRLLQRRQILELAGAGAMAGVVGWPNEAEASLSSFITNMLGYLARVLAPALVPLFGAEFSKLIEGRAQRRAQTTSNIDFHATFAPNIEIVGLQVPLLPSNWGYWVEINGILRADSQSPVRNIKDLNVWEMHGLPVQPFDGEVLFPYGERRKPDAADYTSFAQLCRARRLDYSRLTLDYVRPFTSSKLLREGIAVPGYCASSAEGRGLIVKV